MYDFKSKRNTWALYLSIFTIGCFIRFIPEIFAHPYPIGYDVINYYIPVITNFGDYWPRIMSHFPLYVSLMYLFDFIFGLGPYYTVMTFATFMFGFFAVGLLFLAKHVFKIGIGQSVFLVLFVVFQTSVLRTSWDLHRDIFALSIMFFLLSLYNYIKEQDTERLYWKYALVVALSIICVSSDRMVGLLLSFSFMLNLFIEKNKPSLILALLVPSVLMLLIFMSNYSYVVTAINDIIITDLRDTNYNAFYNSKNLIVLFFIVSGCNIITGVIGFFYSKNSKLLKILLLITTVFSFTWILFPNDESLVADRWITLNAIILSIFSAFGLVKILEKFKSILLTKHSFFQKKELYLICYILILLVPVSSGLYYQLAPYDTPFPLIGIADDYIRYFFPLTMQFNSLDIKDNNYLLTAIEWINHNTEKNAIIIGEKHWRGFMELYLVDNRTYYFYPSSGLESVELFLKDKPLHSAYLIDLRNLLNNQVYSNNLFYIYRLN